MCCIYLCIHVYIFFHFSVSLKCSVFSYQSHNFCSFFNSNKYAIDFELLLALDGPDVQYEVICPESLKPSSDSQCPDQDQFLEDFCNLSTDTVLPSTKKEEINGTCLYFYYSLFL